MLIRISFFSALGGFLFGYDLGLIGGALLGIADELGIEDSFRQEAIVGALKFGAFLGTFLGGALMLRYGRRKAIAMTAVTGVLGPLVMACAYNTAGLVVGRVVSGLGIGASAIVVPAYLAELAPAKHRGAMVQVYEVMLTLGMLCSTIVDWALSHAGPHGWRWMVGLPAIPGAVIGLALLVLPESPRYLVMQGQLDEALHTLQVSLQGSALTNKLLGRLKEAPEKLLADAEDELLLLWSSVEKDKHTVMERRAALLASRSRKQRYSSSTPGATLETKGTGEEPLLEAAVNSTSRAWSTENPAALAGGYHAPAAGAQGPAAGAASLQLQPLAYGGQPPGLPRAPRHAGGSSAIPAAVVDQREEQGHSRLLGHQQPNSSEAEALVVHVEHAGVQGPGLGPAPGLGQSGVHQHHPSADQHHLATGGAASLFARAHNSHDGANGEKQMVQSSSCHDFGEHRHGGVSHVSQARHRHVSHLYSIDPDEDDSNVLVSVGSGGSFGGELRPHGSHGSTGSHAEPLQGTAGSPAHHRPDSPAGRRAGLPHSAHGPHGSSNLGPGPHSQHQGTALQHETQDMQHEGGSSADLQQQEAGREHAGVMVQPNGAENGRLEQTEGGTLQGTQPGRVLMASLSSSSFRRADLMPGKERHFAATLAAMLLDIKAVLQGPESRACVIACCLAIFNQATASTAILNYAPTLLTRMGSLSSGGALAYTIVIALTKVVGVAIGLVTVDVVGRRPLLIWGALGCGGAMVLATGCATLSSAAGLLVAMCAFIFAFSVSWAGVYWVVVSEVFSMAVKSPASSLATSLLFLSGSVTNLVFLGLVDGLHEFAFLVFAGVAGASAVFVWQQLPETKGRTLADVQVLINTPGAARQPPLPQPGL